MPFSDDFERSDGDLGNDWQYTAGKWTIASGSVVGTPGLGANLVANPGFDSDTSWFKEEGWTIAAGVATKAPATGNDGIRQTVTTAGNWYRYDWTITSRAAGTLWANYQSTPNLQRNAAATYLDTLRANGTSAGIEGDASCVASIDNVSVKLITLADMFCVRNLGSSDIEISVPATIVSGAYIGIVICLDSLATPANFIIAHCNRARLLLTKCVGGTYTQLINSTITYGAGQEIGIIKEGTTVAIYYNGVQVGTNQTISDAGIISNTLHGIWSTCPENSLGGFAAVNP